MPKNPFIPCNPWTEKTSTDAQIRVIHVIRSLKFVSRHNFP